MSHPAHWTLCRKGHFDDFRVLKDTGGKLFVGQNVRADERLADVFRGVEVKEAVVMESSSSSSSSSSSAGGRVEERTVELLGVAPGTVRLLAVAVRDGAQPMLDAWIDAWVNRGGGSRGGDDDRDCPVVVELSVVDSFVMRLAPFRRMLYSKSGGAGRGARTGGVGGGGGGGGGGRQVFMFTNSVGYDWVMGTFDNRLVGYVYLLDRRGRVRWRGCGFPERDEVDLLIKETERVMRET